MKKKNDKKIGFEDKQVGIASLLIMILGGLGLLYPVVGRDAVWFDVPKSLLAWSIVLGFAYSAWCIRRIKSSLEGFGSIIFSCVAYFTLGVLFMLGTLCLINGVFDTSVVQIYNARVVDQYISGGKSTSYFLKLEDWKNPSGVVTLQTDGYIYEKFNDPTKQPPGRIAQVKTSNGFLGYERLIKVR